MSQSPGNTAVVLAAEPSARRDVDQVPFVELHNDRVQGVVSSGSDPARVYCAFLEAATGDYYSSTNNNRPDAGMEKRLQWLLDAAGEQYGVERVARYLQAPGDPSKCRRGSDVLTILGRRGSRKQEPAANVFSRFLNYLRFVELTCEAGPVPEMSWFVGG